MTTLGQPKPKLTNYNLTDITGAEWGLTEIERVSLSAAGVLTFYPADSADPYIFGVGGWITYEEDTE